VGTTELQDVVAVAGHVKLADQEHESAEPVAVTTPPPPGQTLEIRAFWLETATMTFWSW
jgi:hypothetical protein